MRQQLSEEILNVLFEHLPFSWIVLFQLSLSFGNLDQVMCTLQLSYPG